MIMIILQKQVNWLIEADELLDGKEPLLNKEGLDKLKDLVEKHPVLSRLQRGLQKFVVF